MSDKYNYRQKINFGNFKTSSRTNLCGELRKYHVGKTVKVCGWVNKRRDHGKLIFIDLRDFSGIVQIVFDTNCGKKTYDNARQLRTEYVISVEGKLKARSGDTVNEELPTGEIEIFADTVEVFSTSKTAPFMLDNRKKIDELARLKYRYIDLRTEEMQHNLRLRNLVTHLTRDYLTSQGFVEVETPILAKSTPEGARDFLVPSRLSPGTFYALPQSPQLFKQILMFSGFDRIYQIARCFRDEDLRADRQPEFTQIDLEMSFVKVDDVINLIENLLHYIFKESIKEELSPPFPRLSWKESIETYGTDKPDTRFELKINDISEVFKNSQFNIFINVLNKKGCIKCLKIEDSTVFSRKDFDDFVDMSKKYGAGGLIWVKIDENKVFNSPVAKFISNEEKSNLIKKLNLKEKNMILVVADECKKACETLGAIRTFLGMKLNLIDEDKFNFTWIVDFPLFEYSEKDKSISPTHHPFTSPSPETIKYLDKEPLKVFSLAYDIVLNGNEIGGGSIRINKIELQKKIFKILGFNEKKIEENFGFFLRSLEYGAPPHGGIALGMDRLVMLIGKLESIREG
ncbi:MAG: aspartate--tRNA ligase, partial [Actinobacteria bacterium]|nr:aspartate--tRNA ligase [Actinomycetota bacterium]